MRGNRKKKTRIARDGPRERGAREERKEAGVKKQGSSAIVETLRTGRATRHIIELEWRLPGTKSVSPKTCFFILRF